MFEKLRKCYKISTTIVEFIKKNIRYMYIVYNNFFTTCIRSVLVTKFDIYLQHQPTCNPCISPLLETFLSQ